MGLFSKNHTGSFGDLIDIFKKGSEESEEEFESSLVAITNMVEEDDSYSTNEKLNIYDIVSKLSNCNPAERAIYARKLEKALK